MKKRRENIKNSLKKSSLKKNVYEKERAKGQKKEPKGK